VRVLNEGGSQATDCEARLVEVRPLTPVTLPYDLPVNSRPI